MNIIVTGGAGFIGSNLIDRLLLDQKNAITCIDNFDDFYSKELKQNNLKSALQNPRFTLIELDIRDNIALKEKLTNKYDVIIHLAAKAGVRPSIENAIEYQSVNVIGTQTLLDFAHKKNIEKFIFASSSSVYGVNPNYPWKESDSDLKPISPYSASKLSGEFLGSVYSTLYDIQFLALRFFTVYGPRQRPDLAIHKFVKSIFKNETIQIYGDGSTSRDYTFIDDILSGILASLNYNKSKFEIINLGNSTPTQLTDLIKILEISTKHKAKLDYVPEKAGDVTITYASIDKAKRLLNYNPVTNLEIGVKKFVDWYLNYYK